MNLKKIIFSGLVSLGSLSVVAAPQAPVDQNRCEIFESAGAAKHRYFVYLKDKAAGAEVPDGWAELEKPEGKAWAPLKLSKSQISIERFRERRAPLQNIYVISSNTPVGQGGVVLSTGRESASQRRDTETGMLMISCPK